MRHWIVWLLCTLAIIALSLFIWDAYTEASGHPLMGAFSHLLLWIAGVVFLLASASVAVRLAPRSRSAHSNEAQTGRSRSSSKARPPEMLRSGMNPDPRAWDENENLPPDRSNM
jgi:type VI protein secretion system component VasK